MGEFFELFSLVSLLVLPVVATIWFAVHAWAGIGWIHILDLGIGKMCYPVFDGPEKRTICSS